MLSSSCQVFYQSLSTRTVLENIIFVLRYEFIFLHSSKIICKLSIRKLENSSNRAFRLIPLLKYGSSSKQDIKECANSECPDQPALLRRLIRAFDVTIVLKYQNLSTRETTKGITTQAYRSIRGS